MENKYKEFIAFLIYLVLVSFSMVQAESFRITSIPATSTYATMDATPTNYKCLKLRRQDSNELTFCTRKTPLVLKGEYNVRGMYVVATDTIFLDKNSPNDRIVHELFHAVDRYNKKDDAEKRAYEFQYLYLQLVAKKLIK